MNSKKSEIIDELRKKIDSIDEDLLALVNDRMRLAKEVGAIKEREGQGGIIDPAREAKVIDRLVRLNRGPLEEKHLRHILAEIIVVSRQMQQSLQIVYLGPQASFTHMAAMRAFGHFAAYEASVSLTDLFRHVERGRCRFGVAPVENAVEGAVNHMLDLFLDSELRICGETYQEVAFDLMRGRADSGPVQAVYATDQAASLCRRWLQIHQPQAQVRICETSVQAMSRAGNRAGTAALGSGAVAGEDSLMVVNRNVNDAAGCQARFLIVAAEGDTQPAIQAGPVMKTSVMFAAANQPGFLNRILTPLANANINLINITSHPTGRADWQDLFMVDLEGDANQPEMRHALDEMGALCRYFKELGSYPAARPGTGVGSTGKGGS